MHELRKNENVFEDLHTVFLGDRWDHLRFSLPLAKLIFALGTCLQELASDPLLFVSSD